MNTLRGACWLLAALATIHLWTDSQNTQTRNFQGVTVVRALPFRTIAGESLALDLYLPATTTEALSPLVIAVHGGSWTGGSRRDYGPQFAPLAREGVAVAVVDYRLARPGAPSWPGALEDVRSALETILARAPEFRIDPNRVAALGTSSGGLLAARAAQVDPRIMAAICLSSPTLLPELVAGRNLQRDPVPVFLGADPNTMLAASPRAHVEPMGPAMMLIHGGADAWVPIDQARKMRERLEEASVFNRLVEIPGARHGYELQVGAPNPRDLTPEILRFLHDAWAAADAEHARPSP